MSRTVRSQSTVVYQPSEIDRIRQAAQCTATVLHQLAAALTPGMSTGEVDRLAAELILASGGESAFHGYHGFPGQICISLNDEVVHGIGNPARIIQSGDLVSLDVGIRLHGFIGDTALTCCVGASKPEQEQLLTAGRTCLERGIAAARAGGHVNDIGRAIESTARQSGYSVVRDFVGHGCGKHLHEPPEVPNFQCPRPGPELRNGMVLAIEPMINQGGRQVTVDDDGWTVRTRDGSSSVHFEHMIAINNGEAEILTWPKKV